MDGWIQNLVFACRPSSKGVFSRLSKSLSRFPSVLKDNPELSDPKLLSLMDESWTMEDCILIVFFSFLLI
jgi:hypothetical protein